MVDFWGVSRLGGPGWSDVLEPPILRLGVPQGPLGTLIPLSSEHPNSSDYYSIRRTIITICLLVQFPSDPIFFQGWIRILIV